MASILDEVSAGLASASTPAVPVATRNPEDYPGGYVRTEWKLLAKYRTENAKLTGADLARLIGFSQQTIYLWRRDPAYQRYENWIIGGKYDETPLSVRTAREEVQDRIQSYAVEMEQRLEHIVETTGDEKLAVVIAQDFLDRAGHAKLTRHEHKTAALVLTADALELLDRRAEEAGV